MMNFFIKGILLLLLLSFAGCQSGAGNENMATAEIDLADQQVAAAPEKSAIDPAQKNTYYELLQGKWRHVEDTTNFLVFEENIRKEIAAGMDEWYVEPFVLADHCQNETDSGRGLEEGMRYLSTPESDLCWLIDEVSETSLVLISLGRGNSLIYTRIHE